MQVIAIANAAHEIVDHTRLIRAEPVHRQLRPQLPAHYAERMQEIFRHGAEMAIAVEDEAVRGVAVFRMIENTFSGRELYCDDLVTDEKHRSRGAGHALVQYMEALARSRGRPWS